jgi:hypothetical protein
MKVDVKAEYVSVLSQKVINLRMSSASSFPLELPYDYYVK